MSSGFSDPPASDPGSAQGYAAGVGPSGPRASFGLRLLAMLVDAILLYIVGRVIGAVLATGLDGFVNFIFGVGYYVYLEGSPSGQTVGKKLLNIRVVDFNSGGRIDYGRAAIRYFARILSTIPLFLGYFWMLWDKEKQTWHDKLSTTVVVPTASYPVDKWPG